MNTIIQPLANGMWVALVWRLHYGKWIYFGMRFGDDRADVIRALEEISWK
jgi:hypothetical protein